VWQDITDYWNELVADLTVKRDNNGRMKGHELQLDVPLHAQALTDRSSFHLKQRVQMTKFEKGMDDADIEAYERECQMGHRRTDSEYFASHGASSRALCPGTIGHSQFSQALPSCAVGYKEVKVERPGDDDKVKVELEEGEQKASAGDVELAIAETVSSLGRTLGKTKAKLEDVVREAWVSLARLDVAEEDKTYKTIVENRVKGARAILGLADLDALETEVELSDSTASNPKKQKIPGVSPPELHVEGDQPTADEKKKSKAEFGEWLTGLKKSIVFKPAAIIEGTDVLEDYLAGLGDAKPIRDIAFLKSVAALDHDVAGLHTSASED
jgi:hypothetical protein